MTAKQSYDVVVRYRAREGFTVSADNPEHAILIVQEGDPDDPHAPGDRYFDEYEDVDGYIVFDASNGAEVLRRDACEQSLTSIHQRLFEISAELGKLIAAAPTSQRLSDLESVRAHVSQAITAAANGITQEAGQ